jgi:Flp pilus assembly protein TadD
MEMERNFVMRKLARGRFAKKRLAEPVGRALGAACAAAALVCLLALPARAQVWATVTGTVYGADGKPWADVTVTIANLDTGGTSNVQTDKNGVYSKIGLAPGVYQLSVHAPNFDYIWAKVRLSPGENKYDVDLKEALAQNAAYMEEKKKEEEATRKFQALKVHFDAGVKALQQAELVHNQVLHAPADQRTALEQQVASYSQTAISELVQAQQAAKANDPNMHIVLANLAKAYETAGKYDQAVATMQKAIVLKPDQPTYYILLGTDQAQLGKLTEAEAACTKAATLDPVNAGVCWRNVGIVLMNAGNMKGALDPLRKATETDPKNPDGWYWLGSSLLAAMDYKQVGTKIEYIVQPGTAEAFQKYLALAPNGPYADNAKQALAQLTVITQGTSTVVSEPRKKKK